LFRKYHDRFAFSNSQLGRTSLVQRIIDTSDALPIKKRPCQTTPENRQETDHQVEDALESLWSSSIVLIQKKIES